MLVAISGDMCVTDALVSRSITSDDVVRDLLQTVVERLPTLRPAELELTPGGTTLPPIEILTSVLGGSLCCSPSWLELWFASSRLLVGNGDVMCS